MASFDIDIATTGEVTIKAEGFTGGSCLKRAEGLLRDLGNAEVSTDLAYVSETEEEFQW